MIRGRRRDHIPRFHRTLILLEQARARVIDVIVDRLVIAPVIVGVDLNGTDGDIE